MIDHDLSYNWCSYACTCTCTFNLAWICERNLVVQLFTPEVLSRFLREQFPWLIQPWRLSGCVVGGQKLGGSTQKSNLADSSVLVSVVDTNIVVSNHSLGQQRPVWSTWSALWSSHLQMWQPNMWPLRRVIWSWLLHTPTLCMCTCMTSWKKLAGLTFTTSSNSG